MREAALLEDGMRLRHLRYVLPVLGHWLFSNPCCYSQNPDLWRKKPGK